MPDSVHVSISEVTILTGKSKAFKLTVDDHEISIPVDEALFAHYKNQFYREHPTAPQRQKFATLLNLMRAAYKQGLRDAKIKK